MTGEIYGFCSSIPNVGCGLIAKEFELIYLSNIESSANEVAKLVRRTEYHMGSSPVKSVMVARRKTAEDRVAPQTQIVYGEC
jgi:hypothetical protein